MKTAPIARSGLSPHGSARRRLDRTPTPAWPEDVARLARDSDLDEAEFALAWEVSGWPGHLDDAERRQVFTVVARSLVAVAEGSTRLAADEQIALVMKRAPSLFGRPGERRPFIADAGHLYQQKHHVFETRVAAAVRFRNESPPPFAPDAVEESLRGVLASASPALSDDQEAAVRAVLGRRLGVVSGGPGTGKTTIALAIVRALARLGVSPDAIGLGAPTGKAANRLEETMRAGLASIRNPAPKDVALAASTPSAHTLHRLLGYSPASGTFLHHRASPLPLRAVVVDECSMIDVALMDRLVAALADDAVLVLLGDADQLPSVEAGAVFRDLAPLAVRLRTSHRVDVGQGAGRAIVAASAAVQAGDAAALGGLLASRPSADDVVWSGAEHVGAAQREALLAHWYEGRLRDRSDFETLCTAVHDLDGDGFAAESERGLDALHRIHQASRLLGVTRGRPTGVEATNAWLHQRHGAESATPIAGEPIMMLRNDYQRGLWNGDQGVVVLAREPGRPPRPVCAFPSGAPGARRWVAFDLDALRDRVEIAFALTVHKAQGSEWDVVALLLPDEPIPLLTRELLYTALSRARRGALVCGSLDVLAAGAARALARSSGLGERIAALASAAPAGGQRLR